MNEKEDQLFLLIKSLSKNEKVYFKRSAKKHIQGNNNNYLKLFDIISKQKKYDEEKILKKIAHEKYSRQLHVTKNYLYNNILKCIEDYHYNISIDASLKHALLRIEILYKKGLYDSCSKLLAKAKKTAIVHEHETHSFLLDVIEWERKLLYKQMRDINKTQYLLRKLKKEEENVLKIYANNRDYLFLLNEIILIIDKEGIEISKESKKTIAELCRNPLLKSEKNALSLTAKLCFNKFYERFYDLEKDDQSSLKYIKRTLELMESRPEILKNMPVTYIEALNNLGVLYYLQKNYSKIFPIIDKIKTIPEKTIDIKVEKFLTSDLLEIATYNSMGEFEKSIGTVTKINKGLKEYKDKINLSNCLNVYIEIANAFFGTGNYKTSLTWLNKLLSEKHNAGREDIIVGAKLLNLIVHFEMGNHELLESLIPSTIRYFVKETPTRENKKLQYDTELLFIQTLKKMINESKNKNLKMTLKSIKEKILVKTKNTSPYNSNENHELILNWLESKMENRSYAAIIREKSKLFFS